MKLQGNRSIAVLCLWLLSVLAVCDTAAAKPPTRGLSIRSGPPAHAPAHGYRCKQIHGFNLIFDVGLGLYVAVGVTDVYYHEGHFYRCRGGIWEISLHGATWEAAGIEKLPPGLQIKAKSMIKLNGNGNSLVKLNGNAGGSNGNAAGPGVKPNNSADAGVNKPIGTPANNAGKPGSTLDAGSAKANGPTDAAGKSTGNGAAPAKPAGSGNSALSKTNTPPNTAVNKPAAKPSASGSPKPAGKGKKK